MTRSHSTPCSSQTRAGRLEKARQFRDAAEIIDALADEAEDLGDAYVTMCVHGGIAAADVICCARLGEHAQGQDHAAAIRLLASADKASSRHLQALLAMKTKSGYSALKSSKSERVRAGRALRALLETAEAHV